MGWALRGEEVFTRWSRSDDGSSDTVLKGENNLHKAWKHEVAWCLWSMNCDLYIGYMEKKAGRKGRHRS